ncbi:MAG TPA: hypothetical protein VFG45_00030 [Candidatus Nitrosocosmicus sp.]|nr:hypothetical protein [Candidatus Nitrosocosmicus sp.]
MGKPHNCYNNTTSRECVKVVILIIPLLILFITSFIIFQSSNGQMVNSTTTTTTSIGNSKEISSRDVLDFRYSDLVNFTSKIKQIDGHLNASLLNKYDGNESLALAHAEHPIGELYPFVGPQIAITNQSLNQSLYLILMDIPEYSKNSTNEEYLSVIQSTQNLLKDIINEVIPKNLQNDKLFNSFVVVNLLDLAGHEYQAGVTNDTITAIFEYQDSKAFIQQAEKLLSTFYSDSETSIDSSGLWPLVNSLNAAIEKVSTPEEIYLSIDSIFSKISLLVNTDKLTLLSKLGVSAD